jgi:hypothetical protein
MELSLLPRDNCGLDNFDAALTRFSQAAPQIKKSILTAAAQTVATDGVILEIEAELLRAIADTLDCPIPPVSEIRSNLRGNCKLRPRAGVSSVATPDHAWAILVAPQ